jgi:salicylate hydroxylase
MCGQTKVIGCDGIKSRIRKVILGEDHPAADPSYSHQYALRGMVPMDLAIEALGEYKARNRHMHLGPDSHVVTVPIGLGKLINVVAFIKDSGDWEDATQLTGQADPQEVLKGFEGFGRPLRNLIKTLVDVSPRLDKWGIFDSVDNPPPTFASNRVCIAGDAAHATSPHHGAGAGMGIEDSLVLSTLLADVASTNLGPGVSRAVAIRAALAAYSNIRMERARFVAESSRVIGQIFEWRYQPTLQDWDKCLAELTWRSHRIWNYDQRAMIKKARAEHARLLAKNRTAVPGTA